MATRPGAVTPQCPQCGGNCSPECGRHPLGCMFGGFGIGYWIAIDGCELKHGGDEAEQKRENPANGER